MRKENEWLPDLSRSGYLVGRQDPYDEHRSFLRGRLSRRQRCGRAGCGPRLRRRLARRTPPAGGSILRTWTKPVVRVNCPEAPAFAAAGTSSALAAVYDALLGPDQWIRRAGVGGRTPRACAVRRTRCGVQRSRSSGHDVRTTPNLRDRYCRGRLRLPSIHRPSCNLAPSWDQTTDDRAARNRTPRTIRTATSSTRSARCILRGVVHPS